MMEADEAEAARAKAETARARAEWEATKKIITGGSLNPVRGQPVELPSQLARDTLTVLHDGSVGVDPAQGTVEQHEKNAVQEPAQRAQAEGGPVDSQATTDEDTIKAAFKISLVKTGESGPRQQVEEPDREKEHGEDAVFQNQQGEEGEERGEEEGEPMKGLEEERPVETGVAVGKERPAEGQMAEKGGREKEKRAK
jgi:hypothetical protein